MNRNLTIRPVEVKDISLIVDYFHNADPVLLEAMGVDRGKIPSKSPWTESMRAQILLPYNKKSEMIYILEKQGNPIGHCKLDNIKYGYSGKLHLHIWHDSNRRKGIGEEMVKRCLPYFFGNFNLKTIICEPYAANEGPNRVLQKSGFAFVKKYRTTPGPMNFEQDVNRHVLEKDSFIKNDDY